MSYLNIGLYVVISDNGKDILSGKNKYLYGIKDIKLVEFGVEYSINNLSFLQVNHEIKTYMYNRVLDNIGPYDNIVDAYSGAGLLSAIMAKKCNYVIGIEINKSANESAINLCKNNNITNVNFVCGDVGVNLSTYLHNANVVVLDPPRAGCDDKVINELLSANSLLKIIYISCDTATLSRDLAKLNQHFMICEIVPMDMFPQTKHVETFVCLQKR